MKGAPSIMPMISPTLRDDSTIPSIVLVTCDTAVPPRVDVSSAPRGNGQQWQRRKKHRSPAPS